MSLWGPGRFFLVGVKDAAVAWEGVRKSGRERHERAVKQVGK